MLNLYFTKVLSLLILWSSTHLFGLIFEVTTSLALAEDLLPTPPVQYPYDQFGMIPRVNAKNQGKYPLKFVCSTHGQEWVYAMALSASFVDYIRDNPFTWLVSNNLAFLPVVKRQDPDIIINSSEWINYVSSLPSAPLAIDRYTLPILFPEQFNVLTPPFADSYLVGQSPISGRECSIEYSFIHPDLGYPVIAQRGKAIAQNSFKSLDVTFKGTFVAVPSSAKWAPSLESISALELELKSQDQEILALKSLVAKQNAELKQFERWTYLVKRFLRLIR
jgi:hypothetical protein